MGVCGLFLRPGLPLPNPVEMIGDIMHYLASLALDVEGNAEEPIPSNDMSPIPISGVGLTLGMHPGTSILAINMGGIQLGFECSNESLEKLASDFSQTARLLVSEPKMTH